jgi:hypothetical protein
MNSRRFNLTCPKPDPRVAWGKTIKTSSNYENQLVVRASQDAAAILAPAAASKYEIASVPLLQWEAFS